jgi:hypothetical protein
MAQILQVNVIEIKNNGHFTPVSVHVMTFCWRRTTLIPEYPQRTTFMLEYPQRTTLIRQQLENCENEMRKQSLFH